MKTGDYILDMTLIEHKANAKKLGWKACMHICWGLDGDMVEDNPHYSQLPDHHREKYELVYEIYWDFYKENASE